MGRPEPVVFIHHTQMSRFRLESNDLGAKRAYETKHQGALFNDFQFSGFGVVEFAGLESRRRIQDH